MTARADSSGRSGGRSRRSSSVALLTRAALPAGLRSHLAQPLYRTAYSLMAATVLTSVLGAGFWVVAARLYPPEVVGLDCR
jgi:hypothetical protein